MKVTHAIRVVILVLVCLALPQVQADPTSRIEALSKLDLGYMDQQRARLGDIAAMNLGRQFSGDRDRDLDLLQTLLDRRLVRPDQTEELQAMGIILGDLLAAEFGLHWVVFRDEVGRSRALRYRETDFLLFPVTMISRRREVDNNTPVAEIYQRASDVVVANKPSSLFQ